jgi:hypothetical protein
MCPSTGGTPVCNNGVCGFSACNPGLADCPGDTGCTTNITNDVNNCGACGNVCETQCGGAGDHVTATTCNNSQCVVTGCQAGFNDFNQVCAGGCECADATVPTVCGNASSLQSTALTIGQSSNPVSSTMAPAPAQGGPTEAFFTVTFSENTDTRFHPKITLTSASGEFVMDVTSSCTGTLLNCVVEGSQSQGITTWEEFYTAGDPASYPVTGSAFDPIPPPGAGGQVWIKVYRKGGATPTCDEYTLTASE